MIWASVLLAIYVAWPLAFGRGGDGDFEGVAEVRVMRSVAPRAKPVPASRMPAQESARPESCYKRYQREVKLCDGVHGAACRLGTADRWDMCEASGFWPE